jgi:hypothetical protein
VSDIVDWAGTHRRHQSTVGRRCGGLAPVDDGEEMWWRSSVRSSSAEFRGKAAIRDEPLGTGRGRGVWCVVDWEWDRGDDSGRGQRNGTETFFFIKQWQLRVNNSQLHV